MIFVQAKQHSSEWIKYLAVALICALVAIDGMSFAFADPGKSGGQYVIADNKGDSDEDYTITMVMKSESVAARLGGYHGILGFLHNFAVPALLADAEVASFFGNLTTTPDDIEQCLAMLLDHDLGGSSKKNGAVLESGHRCRSSMSKIHRGRNIPDETVTKFISIVGEQAALVGVSAADVAAIAKVLERYRGGTRNK